VFILLFTLGDLKLLRVEKNLSLSMMLNVFKGFWLSFTPRVYSKNLVLLISSFVGDGDVLEHFTVTFMELFTFSIPVTFFKGLTWSLF